MPSTTTSWTSIPAPARALVLLVAATTALAPALTSDALGDAVADRVLVVDPRLAAGRLS